MKLVLLHDTWELDFAGDVLGFLHALGLDVRTVVGAPNKGEDLGQKERRVLDESDGWIFLLTPGSERGGESGYASQSVCDEVGRAEERFKKDPSKVIYFADANWKPHAICQKAFIRFSRGDHRSMTRAFRDLVNELRDMGAFAPRPKPPAQVTIADLAARTPEPIKKVCAFVAGARNRHVSYERLDWFLRQNTQDATEANLLKMDLMKGWLQPGAGGCMLSNWGMELVRYEREKPAPMPEALELLRMLAMYPTLFPKPKKPGE